MFELSLAASTLSMSGSYELLNRVRFESQDPIVDALNILKSLQSDILAVNNGPDFLQKLNEASTLQDYQVIVTELLASEIRVLLYEVADNEINAELVPSGTVEHLLIGNLGFEFGLGRKLSLPAGSRISEIMTQLAGYAGLIPDDYTTVMKLLCDAASASDANLGYTDSQLVATYDIMLNQAGYTRYALTDIEV